MAVVAVLANGGLHFLLDRKELLVVGKKIHQQCARVRCKAKSCKWMDGFNMRESKQAMEDCTMLI